MTLQWLVLIFTREGFAIRILYRRRFFQPYPSLKRWHDNERRAWQLGDTEIQAFACRR